MNHTSIQGLLRSRLLRLDVEFGNAKGFFSASKSGAQPLDPSQPPQTSEYEAGIPDAKLKINDSVIVADQNLTRNTIFSAKQDCDLFDLVSRFVVLSNDRKARIANTEIQHSCKNIYHQHAVKGVTVPIGTNSFLQFTDFNTAGHPLFDRVFYVRDEAIESGGLKRWIVHHRLIVKQQTANLIVRCCHPKFEGPLPFQKIIPQALKEKLFRIREKQNPNFPFMAVGEVPLNANHQVDIRTRIQLVDE